jgi:tRNA-specific 2-thiouridylase
VKIRYNHKGAPATIIPTGADSAHICFDEPQRAPADGQSAVFYDGDTVIGGGIIRQSGK